MVAPASLVSSSASFSTSTRAARMALQGPLPLVLAEPLAGAAIAGWPQADVVHDIRPGTLTSHDSSPGVARTCRLFSEQLASFLEPGLQPGDLRPGRVETATRDERIFATDVETGHAAGTKDHEGGLHSTGRLELLGGAAAHRSPLARPDSLAHRVTFCHFAVCQLGERLTFAAETALQGGTDQQKEPRRGEHHFPATHTRIVGPDPQRFGGRENGSDGRGFGSSPVLRPPGRETCESRNVTAAGHDKRDIPGPTPAAGSYTTGGFRARHFTT